MNETFHLFPYDAAVPNHNTIHLLHSIYTQYEPIYILYTSKRNMIAKEDENDNEVRREDQDRINQFARLNARLQDNKSEREQIKV